MAARGEGEGGKPTMPWVSSNCNEFPVAASKRLQRFVELLFLSGERAK
jgi:hypothetical protein